MLKWIAIAPKVQNSKTLIYLMATELNEISRLGQRAKNYCSFRIDLNRSPELLNWSNYKELNAIYSTQEESGYSNAFVELNEILL